MEQIPKTGERYRDVKGSLYQVVVIAEDVQTKENQVVYQALQDDYKVYAQPVCSFLKCMTEFKVHKPQTVVPQAVSPQESSQQYSKTTVGEEEINPYLLKFLEADSFDEKYNILVSMSDAVTDRLIDDIAIVMDIVVPEGPLLKRYDDLKRAVRTRQHYEFSNRLR